MIKKNAEKGEDFPAQRMKEKRGAGFNEAIMESVPGSMAVDTGKCDGRSLCRFGRLRQRKYRSSSNIPDEKNFGFRPDRSVRATPERSL